MKKQKADKTSPMRILFLFLVFLMVLSCGGRPARQGGMGRDYYKGAVPSEADDESSVKDRKSSGLLSAVSEKEKSYRNGKKPDAEPEKPTTRIVIYHGYYTITVESVPVAIKGAEALAKRFKGYVESSSTRDRSRRATVTIRVPVKSFNEALKACEKLGEVTNREVKARDITRQFQDTRLRLESHKKVLKRMRELLKKTRKVEERVKILREIERLTAKIETLTRRLNYLKRQASYSTIVLTLKARVYGTVRGYIPSAFGWIARLKPESRSIYDDGDDVEASEPEGFFSNKYSFYKRQRNAWLFTLPKGGAGIRLGVIENILESDAAFWDKALRIELENRKYSFTTGILGEVRWFRIKLPDKSVYEIYVTTGEDYIAVAEVLYDNAETAKKLKSDMERFVKTVRVK